MWNIIRILENYAEVILPLIVLLFYLLNWNKIKLAELPILLFLCVNIVIYSWGDYLSTNYRNNLYVYHFAAFKNFFFFCWILYKHVKPINQKILAFLTSLLLIFCVINIYTFEPIDTFPSLSASISLTTITILGLLFCLKLAKVDEIMYFQKLPIFWFVAAFIIYSAITDLIYLSYNYFTDIEDKVSKYFWQMESFANLAMCTLIILGLSCYKKKYTPPSLLL